MTASEEQLRRGRKALDSLIRRAHGPHSTRTWAEDTEAAEKRDEDRQTWLGGNR